MNRNKSHSKVGICSSNYNQLYYKHLENKIDLNANIYTLSDYIDNDKKLAV